MPIWKIRESGRRSRTADSSLHPVVAALLEQRGFVSEEEQRLFFAPDYSRDIHDPFLFGGMEAAVDRIGEARRKKERVLVYGDYDADGVTSSAILADTLRELGIDTEIYIPDKDKEGYGMNAIVVERFVKEGLKLIITVDCGITNAEEIKVAQTGGADVIVVDHHHVPAELPDAFAIINQKMDGEKYPFRELAGVGTVFKLVQALYRRYLPEKEEKTKWLLDLVAIGTVADCVPLLGENRVFVKYGMLVLSKTRLMGLRELFRVGRIHIDENNLPSSEQIAFQIAPRINAAGRMDHANLALHLVTETDPVKARALALEIEAKNQERQKVTAAVFEEVKKAAENQFRERKFIFAASPHFPSGILGLVAGKISDYFNKPSAVFQEKGDFIKGSFRSVPGLDIIEVIEKCGKLAEKFGGHAQAAGVTVERKNFPAFTEAVEKEIVRQLGGRELAPAISIDLEIKPQEIDFELAENLERMEPFGEGNRKPVFLAKNLKIDEAKLVGNGSKHLKLLLRSQDGSPKIFEAIGFRIGEENSHLQAGDSVDLVFELEIDEWNGNRKLQIKIIDLKKVS